MASKPVWLEVALNGGAGTAYQPNIPITPDAIIAEGVACAKAGAAIIHLHVYDDDGQAFENADRYSYVIDGIRQQCDAIIYPTLALSGTLSERLKPVKELAKRGLLEWGVVDPGSVNISHTSQVAANANGFIYANADADIRALLTLAAEHNWRPAYAIYEPGFARLGKAMADTIEGLLSPIYRVMFSDGLLFGMKPSAAALRFYAQHFADLKVDTAWMVSGLDADIEAIMPLAIELGAHLRVGLEDAPFGCQKSNLELVEQATNIILKSDRRLATVDDIRRFE